jgi:hypothetical protein
MQPPANPGSSSTALLAIRADGSAWGIPSSAVMGVEPFESGNQEPPPDVLSLLGASSPGRELESRVLRLRVGGERLDVLARGALSLIETRAADLLALPTALQGLTPLVSHVALVDGKLCLFVISPERLLKVCRAQAQSLPTSPLPDRGSPC